MSAKGGASRSECGSPSDETSGTAAQEAVMVAVPVDNVTAAERSRRAIEKFIAEAATVGTIEATVLYAAVGTKSWRQVVRLVPIIQESANWRVDWLAGRAGGNSSSERKHHKKESRCSFFREDPAAKNACKAHCLGRPIGCQHHCQPGCGTSNHAACNPLIP